MGPAQQDLQRKFDKLAPGEVVVESTPVPWMTRLRFAVTSKEGGWTTSIALPSGAAEVDPEHELKFIRSIQQFYEHKPWWKKMMFR